MKLSRIKKVITKNTLKSSTPIAAGRTTHSNLRTSTLKFTTLRTLNAEFNDPGQKMPIRLMAPSIWSTVIIWLPEMVTRSIEWFFFILSSDTVTWYMRHSSKTMQIQPNTKGKASPPPHGLHVPASAGVQPSLHLAHWTPSRPSAHSPGEPPGHRNGSS
eukprot:CAMPEP_0115202876 /NCGR_PEP_ID=MMETSP0270-20121206/18358_1 /TAXON_ID=71861 /ORGANISM="Scrippsiella trochoidea, Strain CCMP3099" /LENGTH=158 /DNA_ID=CAMNT_0002616315 /DNA_START=307 /DNA_END=783 /DNA_ORIENTATION=-